jgi:2-aminoethylphosphonate-pyruvate transaminase
MHRLLQMAVNRAIILAAGLGLRLRGTIDDRPKGLIEFGGETLVGRSIRLLREAGTVRISVVLGYHADQYRALVRALPYVDVVENTAYATTGSMASLDAALGDVVEPTLILESDILYERRALDSVSVAAGCATLVSGATNAGDEVWVHAVDGRLIAMSKERARLPATVGEFVGITRITKNAAARMREVFRTFVAREGHGQMAYETGALVDLAASTPVGVVRVPDLIWGEIDDESQYQRVATSVWPAIRAREQ